MRVKGRRIPWDDPDIITMMDKLEPGDYAGPWNRTWLVCAPNGEKGLLGRNHKVKQHKDGTITVTPSLDFHFREKFDWEHWKSSIKDRWTHPPLEFHGWLRQGWWEWFPTRAWTDEEREAWDDWLDHFLATHET